MANELAQRFAESRKQFLEDIISWLCNTYPQIQMQDVTLTEQKQIPIKAFQMWLMLGVLNHKREAYISRSANQQFVDRMYFYLSETSDSAEAISNAIQTYGKHVAEGEEDTVYEEFESWVISAIYGTQLWRGYMPEDLAYKAGFNAYWGIMTTGIILITQATVADVFGDTETASKLLGDLQRFMDEQKGKPM